ncbi:hypothetical protein DM860_007451 [Cuscuta australis]|uniref:Homeobox domain-containing protein n=1 Tax=Cuscuta australis TaxID=267555 RepID=A0A328E860_9ASTE|nr:hypothetical protein DM860_007451 [Cuscuta australis]
MMMMDELYGIHSVLAPSPSPSYAPSSTNTNNIYNNDNNSNDVFSVGIDGDDDDHHRHQSGMINGCGDSTLQSRHHHHHHHGGMMSSSPDVVKAQIANHPLYPNLVSAYFQCTKVAAPPDISTLLEEISQHPPAAVTTTATADEIAGDPELDQFMESYCEAMYKYKEELSKPFDEAKAFLSSIESQLSSLCKDSSSQTSFNSSFHSCDEGGGGGDTSEEEEEYASHGEVEVGDDGDDERQWAQILIKEMLMRKYSGYLSNLRKDFLKKRKKGKLPKDARLVLLQWWDSHYRWPYPTEEEKNKLCEMTGLDQKQINNWFINQRKRHWRPSQDMRLVVVSDITAWLGFRRSHLFIASRVSDPWLHLFRSIG